MAGNFDSKFFNAEVFGKYMETVPRVKQNALLTNGILRARADIKALFDEQTGGNFATVPMLGLLDGTPDNYDGSSNINATATKTYSQGMIVVGRAKAWKERDFSYDLTGTDFLAKAATQIGAYWDEVDEATLLSILKGVFSMNTNSNGFAGKHTLDVTGATTKTVGASTLNSAVQKACGANKSIIKMAIMHSVVATNLENLNLMEYGKYTDANGIQRDVALGTWNGRIVLVDDEVPAEQTYVATSDAALVAGKTYYTKSGSTYTAVASPDVANIGTYYEDSGVNYTTYLLGDGAFDYADVGARVPYEMDRDPHTNGGEDILYTRQRKLFAPRGISFVQPNTPIVSPTAAQLETGSNWALVHDGQNTKSYIDDKAIPIVRIISKG